MTEPCRFCAEQIDVDAEKCPHCGESLHEVAVPPPAKTSIGVILLIIAVVVGGFFCVVGIVAALAIPNLVQVRKKGNEAAAIGAMKVIYTSQVLFREGDKDEDGVLDYGDLQELSDMQLVDPALGSGMKQGYMFQVMASPTTPELLWMATATPVKPGTTGDRYFMIDHEGIVYYSITAPFTFTPDCATPPGASPVGR